MGPKRKKAEDGGKAAAETGRDEVPAASQEKRVSKGKRGKADTGDEGGSSPRKKKAPASEDADDTAGGKVKSGKAAAKAAAEKTVIPKSVLQDVEVPAGKRLLRVVSWNVTTLRSLVNKNPTLLQDLVKKHGPDVIFIQETKLNEADHSEYGEKLHSLAPGYALHWNSCTLAGSKSYSGTLAMVKGGAGASTAKTIHHFFGAQKGTSATDEKEEKRAAPKVTMNVPTLVSSDGSTAVEVNQEGRTITLEFPEVFLVATYVPNSGDKLQRLAFRTEVWDKRLQQYLSSLEEKKPVVWCGDLNVCHLDADIWNHGAKHLEKSAGTTKEERQSFAAGLRDGKFVDCFRQVHGADASGWFSYWSVRAGNLPWNRGLRLDYFVASKSLFKESGGGDGPRVVDSRILSDFVAIDHAAIALTLAL